MSQLWPDWSQGNATGSRNNISMDFTSMDTVNDGKYKSDS